MSCCCLLEDVLIEVLSRLSVKTLMRFKCVSESWFALIQNPNFISTQLNRSMCTKDQENLVIVHRDDYTKEDICTMFPNENQDMSVELRMSPKRQCYILVMGPCNGLFCMYDYFDDFYLCNPATREMKCLPKSIARPPGHVITLGRFGFGFDPKTRDYKVIRLLRCSKENCEYQIALYTLGTNSWRKINAEFQAIIYELYDVSMHLNGVYHWWAFPMGATKYTEHAIVSFDMASECFERTPLPKLSDEHVVGTFTEYNESFAVIFCNDGETNRLFDLWTMDGYGVEVCWTKLLTIGPLEGVGRRRPLGVWKNNEFFFISRDMRPVSYNSKNQIVRILMFNDTKEQLWSPSWIKMVKYTESLVSINGKN